jgi:hypothetical protein
LVIFRDCFLPILFNSLTLLHSSPTLPHPAVLSRDTPSDPIDTSIFLLLILPSNVLHHRFPLFLRPKSAFSSCPSGLHPVFPTVQYTPNTLECAFFLLYLLWEMLHSLSRHFVCLASSTLTGMIVVTYCYQELSTCIGLVSSLLYAY